MSAEVAEVAEVAGTCHLLRNILQLPTYGIEMWLQLVDIGDVVPLETFCVKRWDQ